MWGHIRWAIMSRFSYLTILISSSSALFCAFSRCSHKDLQQTQSTHIYHPDTTQPAPLVGHHHRTQKTGLSGMKVLIAHLCRRADI